MVMGGAGHDSFDAFSGLDLGGVGGEFDSDALLAMELGLGVGLGVGKREREDDEDEWGDVGGGKRGRGD